MRDTGCQPTGGARNSREMQECARRQPQLLMRANSFSRRSQLKLPRRMIAEISAARISITLALSWRVEVSGVTGAAVQQDDDGAHICLAGDRGVCRGELAVGEAHFFIELSVAVESLHLDCVATG